MATTIPEIAEALSTVLTTTADEAAHDTKFVRRRSKLTGSIFVQTLTLGWLGNPRAALGLKQAKSPAFGAESL